MPTRHFAGPMVFLASAMASTDARAREYVCGNQDLEVSCRRGRCERSESFTPSSASINTRTRRMSICLYSTCWEGKAAGLSIAGGFLVARGAGLRSGSGRGSRGRGALVVDLADRSGSLIALGFRNPITCTVRR